MWFEPMQAERIGLAVKRSKHSATLSARDNSMVNWIKTKKMKQRCFASNRIFFLLKTKKNLSNQALVRSKLDLTYVCLKFNDKLSTLILELD